MHSKSRPSVSGHCSDVVGHQRFGRSCCLHLQVAWLFTTGWQRPEDYDMNFHPRENLKSRSLCWSFCESYSPANDISENSIYEEHADIKTTNKSNTCICFYETPPSYKSQYKHEWSTGLHILFQLANNFHSNVAECLRSTGSINQCIPNS
jgi:hypothetical protein